MATQEELHKRYLEQRANIPRGNYGRTGGLNYNPTQAPKSQPYKAPSFGDKVAKVATQTASVVGDAFDQFVVKPLKSTVDNVILTGKTFMDHPAQPLMNMELQNRSKFLEQREKDLVESYRSGKITKDEYSQSLRDLSDAYMGISKEAQKISGGPTPEQRALAVVDTGAAVLSTGKLQLAKTVGTKAATQYAPELLNGATKLEKLVTTVPAVKGLVERNAAYFARRGAEKLAGESAGQYVLREGRRIAGGLLIKKPLFYDLNVGGAQDVYNKILSGDYAGALTESAWLGTQMINGGPLGAAIKGFDWLKGKTSKLAYGTGSFIDEISKKIGDGNTSQISKFLQEMRAKKPEEFAKAEKTFRILQETNLRASANDAARAADNVLTHYAQHGYDLKNVTPQMIYKDMRNWAEADEIMRDAISAGKVKGVDAKDVNKYAVVRWDITAKKGLADIVRKAGPSKQEQMDALFELADRPGVGWSNNRILMKRLERAVYESKTAREAADAIEAIPTVAVVAKGIPKDLAKRLAGRGYTIAQPWGGRQTPVVEGIEDTRKLITGAIEKGDEFFDVAAAPNPILKGVAGFMEKTGLSPRSANEVANRKLAEAVVANLDEFDLARGFGVTGRASQDVVTGGRVILSKLQEYVENKKPFMRLGRSAAITDIRQLTNKEIQEALGVTSREATQISRAVMDAYTKVPLELRGIGDRVVDYLYKYNPAYKHYSRIQSALRYTYNPFFRTQERVETALLSRATSGNLIWNRSRDELNQGVKVLDESGIFSSSLSGEAATENIIGRISANLTQGQKRDLAGMAMAMAKSRGITLEQMVIHHTDEIDDALRVIVQYPRKGLLATPLARTLNIAFFPMRYNAKVTMLAAQILAKQPPTVQMAVLNSLFTFKDWLKSDEGIRWQSQHADAIQVFNWLTPIGSIQSTMKLLTGEAESLGDLGSLGGLPLGVITQMLDSQGVISLNSPYVTPDTGDVLPKYIPETLRARAAVALGDLLGSMFTYPGRTLGLPGKAATIRDTVKNFIDTEGSDFEKRIETERLTPLQKNYIRVLKGDTSDEALDALYNAKLPGEYGYTIPPLALPIRPPVKPKQRPPKRTGLPSGKKKSGRTKKFAQPVPGI